MNIQAYTTSSRVERFIADPFGDDTLVSANTYTFESTVPVYKATHVLPCAHHSFEAKVHVSNGEMGKF
jgi:hypothetical protein